MTVLHPGGFEATDRLAKLCHINRDTRVLDIACGKGTSAVYLAKKYGCKVEGIDSDKNLITQARNLAKRKGLEK
jgi:cyclopropane fatty-acyl-phospholipid synthase-like methyltransferase